MVMTKTRETGFGLRYEVEGKLNCPNGNCDTARCK
jgi:hypothetical protein